MTFYTREQLGKKLLYDLHQSDLKDAFTLVSQGVSLDIKDSSGAMALSVAASGGHAEMVQHLIDCGVDIDQRDNEGYTPLMWAAYAGSAAAVKSLLDAGADAGARNIAGESAADLAKLQSHLLIADKLLDLQIAHRRQAQAEWDGVAVNTGHDIAVSKPLQLKVTPRQLFLRI